MKLVQGVLLFLFATTVSCVSSPKPEGERQELLAATTPEGASARAAPAAENLPPATGEAVTQPTARVGERESVYLGRPVSFWIKQLEEKDRETRLDALNAVLALGPEAKDAVPALAKLLLDEDRVVATRALAALAKVGPEASGALLPLAELLKDEDRFVVDRALAVLQTLGSQAKPLLPAIVGALGHPYPQVRLRAMSIVRNLRPESLPALLEAVHLSGVLFPMPVLMENLRNRWEGVALKSALALEQIGREAVPSLLGALRDERRGAALQVLTGMGPEAEGAVPALMELLAEEPCNPLVPPALVSIGPPAVPALRESVLKGILGSRRELAFAILATMDSRHGLPVLVEAAGDEDQWTALTALKLVAKAPADELAAVRVLAESMLRKYEKHHQQTLQKRSGFRDVASGAFRRMGRDAVPALTVVLREGEARSRHGAASALGTIGPQAWKAMPELIEALEDEDADVRAAAATSLAQVAQDKGVKAELTKLLAEESSEVQKTVQSALDAMEKSEE